VATTEIVLILDSAVEASAPRSCERKRVDSASTAEFRLISAYFVVARDDFSGGRCAVIAGGCAALTAAAPSTLVAASARAVKYAGYGSGGLLRGQTTLHANHPDPVLRLFLGARGSRGGNSNLRWPASAAGAR